MRKFLIVAAVLLAALWVASCCAFRKGPCGPGQGPGMARCEKCPKAADCACKDGKCGKCGAACKCGPDGKCACGCGCAAAAGASPCDKCPKAAAAAAPADAKELQHGPCGAPEGAPAK